MSEAAEIEPILGLPETLPEGERILWQGTPRWRALARSAFHTRKVAIYFGLIAAWRIASGIADGESAAAIAVGALFLVPIALAAIGLLSFLAFMSAKATVYTLTNRRIVMRFGVALPLTVNVPFRIVHAAGLRLNADGTGDIPLALNGRDKIAYLALWPHARPWRLAKPEPMMRCVPDAARVAEMLSEALHEAAPRERVLGSLAAVPAKAPPVSTAAAAA